MDLVLQEKYLVNRIHTKFVMIEDQSYKYKAGMNVLPKILNVEEWLQSFGLFKHQF